MEKEVLLPRQLLSCLFCSFLIRNRPEGKVLETVGVFEVPKQNGKYETGQVSAGLGHLSFSWCVCSASESVGVGHGAAC